MSDILGIPIKYSESYPNDGTIMLVNTEYRKTKCPKCGEMRRTFKDFTCYDGKEEPFCNWCAISTSC